MPTFSKEELKELEQKTLELEASQADKKRKKTPKAKRTAAASSVGTMEKLIAPLLLVTTLVLSYLIIFLSSF